MPRSKYASEEERRKARNEASARSRLKKRSSKAEGSNVNLADRDTNEGNAEIAKRLLRETNKLRQMNTEDNPVRMDQVADLSGLTVETFRSNPHHARWCSKWYPANGDTYMVRVIPIGVDTARVRYECTDPRFERPAYNMSTMLSLTEAIELYKAKCAKVQRKVDRINESQ